MLLSSTTYPLPAHSPWSAGSMSPLGLVVSVPLSTALMPLTPYGAAAPRLILSHPDPSGWQLTDGGDGSGPFLETIGDGMVCASADGFGQAGRRGIDAPRCGRGGLGGGLGLG